MGDVRREGTAGYLLKVPYQTKIPTLRNLYAKDFTPRFGGARGRCGRYR